MDTRSIKHIFFDLDRTLWDFEANSDETLRELYNRFDLAGRNVPEASTFIKLYKEINEECWAMYRAGKVQKEELRSMRFRLALAGFGVNDEALAVQFGDAYIAECPYKTGLFPHTHKVLQSLKERYSLHIITNGFQEVQPIKMRETNLTQYFDVIVTSERAGVKKPHADIFHFALSQAGAEASESVMIGDDLEVDAKAAEAIGMKGIWFEPGHDEPVDGVTHIRSLSQLLEMY